MNKEGKMKYNKWILFLLASALLFAGACSSKVEIFSPVKSEGYRVPVQKKNARVAVISAVDSKINNVLAERITAGLKIKSRFRVLSQDQIKARVGRYPRTIINFELKGDKKALTPYLSRETEQAAHYIQSRLGVDYLILVWVEGVTKVMYSNSFFDNLNMPVYSRMIAYPAKEVVAYSSFGWGKSTTMFSDDDKAIDKMINGIAMQLVFKITKATGSRRATQ